MDCSRLPIPAFCRSRRLVRTSPIELTSDEVIHSCYYAGSSGNFLPILSFFTPLPPPTQDQLNWLNITEESISKIICARHPRLSIKRTTPSRVLYKSLQKKIVETRDGKKPKRSLRAISIIQLQCKIRERSGVHKVHGWRMQKSFT